MTQPLSQTAVFLCKNESFRRWIDRVYGLLDRTTDVAGAAEFIKRTCTVESRREFDTNEYAAQRFRAMHSRYVREATQWGLPDVGEDVA